VLSLVLVIPFIPLHIQVSKHPQRVSKSPHIFSSLPHLATVNLQGFLDYFLQEHELKDEHKTSTKKDLRNYGDQSFKFQEHCTAPWHYSTDFY